jgi:hypothetical protein
MQPYKYPHNGSSKIERMSLSARSRSIAIVFWILTFTVLPIWSVLDQAGWDAVIYHNAMLALKAGHDPYGDAIAIQEAFHRTLSLHPNAIPPYSYVYSPITLPLLRLMGALPAWFSYTLYCFLLLASAFSILWVTTRAMEDNERTFIRLVAPLALFCPGLLAHDTILSGNIAFILYALVLLGATYGWRRGQWRWCYLAIIVASCFKAPLLSLVAIPLLSARRQWLPVAGTIAIGGMLFAIQPLLWPSLFHHFLEAVELQFSYNHDFGSSPAGIFSDILVRHGIPYSPASIVFYLLYATAIFALLLYLSQQFLRGKLTLRQWMPVLLVGVILLNPRIMEYDAAPLAIPMGLIGWRFFTRSGATPRAVITYLSFFLVANFIAVPLEVAWRPTECFLLATFFTAGCWNLLQECRVPSALTPLVAVSATSETEELVPANS